MATLATDMDIDQAPCFVGTESYRFSRDESITRRREHSLSLDRCKRYTETPIASFHCGLSSDEWVVFNYYYSLAPSEHPGEELVACRLRLGRNTLRRSLFALQRRGMFFFEKVRSSSQRIVHISHPAFWQGVGGTHPPADAIDPRNHIPSKSDKLSLRVNDARDFCRAQSRNVRLPYLLFQIRIPPLAKMLYGILCRIGIHTHPTTTQLGEAIGCSPATASRHLSLLEECGMIVAQIREPSRFGEQVRYYYHTSDVGSWRFPKARVWYPSGTSKLAELEASGKLSIVKRRADDEHGDFTSDSSTTLRLISSQIGQPELRLISSQIGQNSTWIGQPSSQIGQVSSWISEKDAAKPCPESVCEEAEKTNNTDVRNTNNNQYRCKSARCLAADVLLSERRWEPEKVSFHPRTINIAKSAAFVWSQKDYRFDQALWTKAVEDVAVEKGEDGACDFVEYAIRVRQLRSGPIPYDVLVIRRMKRAFLDGNPPEQLLGISDGSSQVPGQSRDEIIFEAALQAAPVSTPVASEEREDSFQVTPIVYPGEGDFGRHRPESVVSLTEPGIQSPILNLPTDPERLAQIWHLVWRSIRKSQKPLLMRDLEKQGSKGSALKAFAGRSMEFWVLVEEKAALEKGNLG